MGTLEAEDYQGPFAQRTKPGRAPRPHRIECAGTTPPRPPPLGGPTPVQPEGGDLGSSTDAKGGASG
eukprot:13783657-Alexandrium_andersonii.AAC.1